MLLGYRFAVQRPGQTLASVLGLLIGSAILVAAGTTGDSIERSARADVLADLGQTDYALEFPWPIPYGVVEDGLRSLGDRVALASLAYHERATLVDATTLQTETDVSVWGVQPETFQALGGLTLEDGNVPRGEQDWADGGWILNRQLAHRLHASLGDRISLQVQPYADPPASRDPDGGPISDSSGTFTKNFTFNLTLAYRGPDGAYAHAEDDVYEFRLVVPNHTVFFQAAVASLDQRPPDLDLEAVAPNGTRLLRDAGDPLYPQTDYLVVGTDSAANGTWTLRVHSKAAFGATGNLTTVVQVQVPTVPPPPPPDANTVRLVTHEAPVRAIVADVASDPLYRGPAAFLPRGLVERLHNANESGTVALIASRDDAPISESTFATAFKEPDAARLDPRFGWAAPRVDAVRARGLQLADYAGKDVRQVLAIVGIFPLAAGALLIVSLVGLLVDERKVALATMRAQGARRLHATQAFVWEGLVYALLASLAGVAAGLLLCQALLSRFGQVFLPDVESRLVIRTDTLVGAAGAAVILTLVVAAIASYLATRLNLAASLKGDEDPRGSRKHGLGWSLATFMLGVGLWLAALALDLPVLAHAAPALAGVGLALLLARWLPSRVTHPIVAAAILTLEGIRTLVPEDLTETEEVLLFPVRAIILVLAGAVLLLYADIPARAFAAFLRLVPPLRPVADLAVGHARRKPRRAALTVAMVGMGLVGLVSMNFLAGAFASDVHEGSAGFDVFATTTFSMTDPAAYLADHPPPTGTDPGKYATAIVWADRNSAALMMGRSDGKRVTFQGVGNPDLLALTPALLQHAHLRVVAYDPAFPSAQAAVEAVARDPHLVIVTETLGVVDGPRLRPGAEIGLGNSSGGHVPKTIAATIEAGLWIGGFAHPDTLNEIGFDSGAVVLARARPGEAALLARDLEAAFHGIALQATSVEALAAERAQEQANSGLVFQVFLALGLVVGVASVGILAHRNLLERRREAATLRALGAQPRHLALAVALEAALLLAMGVLIGLVSGAVVAFALLREAADARFDPWALDWSILGFAILAETTMAAVAVAVPAYLAARLQPARHLNVA